MTGRSPLREIAPASRPLVGTAAVPGDKSISHRALIFAGLGAGRARVRGLLDSADVRSSLACMRALGLRVEVEEGAATGQGSLLIEGRAGLLEEPVSVLDCGNSGTTLRLLCGLLAGQPLHAVLTGDASLCRRPMGRLTGPLSALGARFDGRADGSRAPLSVRGRRPLAGGRHDAPVASAQVKTALLLAGLQAAEPLVLTEPAASRDHGERLLRAMGAHLEADQDEQGRARLRLVPGAELHLVDIDVPGDLSSAAFLLVAAALVPGSQLLLPDVGINPSRTGILEVLARMGATVEVQDPVQVGGEPRARLVARAAPLVGADVGGALIPRLIDEIPVLAVAAAFARGTTTFRDAAELRVKESDRISATVALLRALGARAEPLPDGLVVEGSGGAPLPGGEVDAQGDHRIAMAAAVAGLRTTGRVRIRGSEAVDVSFPGFFATLEALRA